MKQYLPQIQVVISIILCVMCGYAFLFVYQATIENHQVGDELQALVAQEQLAKDKVQASHNFLENKSEQIKEIQKHFIFGDDVVPFLDWLEATAFSSNVELQVNSVDIQEKPDALAVGIATKGGFVEIYRFLRLLENSPYELSFSSFNMERVTPLNSPAEGNPTWNAKWDIKLLSFVK